MNELSIKQIAWDDFFEKDSLVSSSKKIEQDPIYTKIREEICLLIYPPGAVLHEGKLAERFNTSRTPIREVMIRLSLDGFLQAKNGVGYIVTKFDYKYCKEVYYLRINMAENIHRLGIRKCTLKQIVELEEATEFIKTLRDDFSLEKYWQVECKLNNVVSHVIANHALREQWNNLFYQTTRLWYYVAVREPEATVDKSYRRLQETLNAVKENNYEAVGFIQRNYIKLAFDTLQAYYAENKGSV